MPGILAIEDVAAAASDAGVVGPPHGGRPDGGVRRAAARRGAILRHRSAAEGTHGVFRLGTKKTKEPRPRFTDAFVSTAGECIGLPHGQAVAPLMRWVRAQHGRGWGGPVRAWTVATSTGDGYVATRAEARNLWAKLEQSITKQRGPRAEDGEKKNGVTGCHM